MRKFAAFVLAVSMLLVFAACGEAEDEPNPALVKYKDEVLSQIPSTEGLDVKVDVSGNGFVFTLTSPLFDSIDDSMMASAEEAMRQEAETALVDAQKEVPECEFIEYIIKNSAGDVLFEIKVE